MTPDLPAYALEFLLPLCRDRFADAALGGFHERLDRAHNPLPMGGKRLMVQCRQLYVLSHAAALGERSGQNAAERGYAFLRRYQDRARGGWYFRATEAGEPLDPAKDLYGHAFLLFALAWLHRAFAAPDALALAAQTMDTLHARMASPHGGFWDNAAADFTPNPVPQRQNPHMHLLEAMLALHAASGDPRWLAEADALTRLFLARLFDPATGTLGEYFTADWTAHPDQGHIVEPGHHYEWVWLLHRYRAQGGRLDAAAAADALYAHAERFGFDPAHGGIQDQIRRDGAPLLATRRIWPVTEAIKARAVRGGDSGALVARLFADFIRPDGWLETLAQDGAPGQTTLPGSTPYHLFMAAAELR